MGIETTVDFWRFSVVLHSVLLGFFKVVLPKLLDMTACLLAERTFTRTRSLCAIHSTNFRISVF